MTERHILVLLGSPRKHGNSTTLAEKLTAGAEAVGATVERASLHELDIRPCAACDACRQPPSYACSIEDDMRALYPKIQTADALVVATPIYWFTMSAQTKLFLDRCYALGGEHRTHHELFGKEIGLLMTYGDDDPLESGAVNARRTFQDAFHYVGAPIVGCVHGSASAPGEIQEQHAVMEQAFRLGQRLGRGKGS
jgi:multimeric flavodoxin WrbA